jgi:transcriptional regulator with XRE-family HTH domain
VRNLTIVLNNCNVLDRGRRRLKADAYAAAHLYYEKELNQEEVARRMEVSRPTVSKLLERVMNSAEKPHINANVSVSSLLRRSPVFRISKPFLSKFMTASKRGKRKSDSTHQRAQARTAGDHDLELSYGLVGFTGGGGCCEASRSASAREIPLAQGALELLKECLPTLPQIRYMGLG